jgi:hypothetical protein
MLELITVALIAMGFNVNCEHYTMNVENANNVKSAIHYVDYGDVKLFDKYVTIDPRLLDDVIICDQTDPKGEN